MSKLILLNEVKKEKVKNNLLKFKEVKSEKECCNESYVTFNNKFNCFQDKEEYIDLSNGECRKISKNKNEKKLNKIMGRIFTLKDNVPIIELINSIYNDDLNINSKVEYINKEFINDNEIIILNNSNYDIKILIEDEYKKFEYEIQFQVEDDENLAIVVNKIDLTDYDNIVSLNKKRREHEENDIDNKTKENYNKCLIMLNSNIEVPDFHDYKLNCEKQGRECKVNIIKGWKYDFKKLSDENMYLLFPLKVLDLRKRLLSINNEAALKELIKDEIYRFFKDMNRYLKKLSDKNIISFKDVTEINLIAIDLLNNFIIEENNIFINIKRDIQKTLKDTVV